MLGHPAAGFLPLHCNLLERWAEQVSMVEPGSCDYRGLVRSGDGVRRVGGNGVSV